MPQTKRRYSSVRRKVEEKEMASKDEVAKPTLNSDNIAKLHELLDQTTLYSQFIQEQRVQAAKDRAERTNASSSSSSSSSSSPSSKRKRSSQRGRAKRQKVVEVEDSDHPLQRLITGGKLREYQIQGVEWLISLYENGLNGILADEMGLGKTVQVISFLAHLRANQVHGPFLVVAPLSTLKQWVDEFNKWAPSIPTLLYHGSKAEREEMRAGLMSSGGASDQYSVVVTSYEIALRDRSKLGLKWKYLVVDEGHRLKNFECKLIKELKQYHSDNRLLLTGTPLQNNLRELWSLLNFLLPALFHSLERFERWFDFDDKTFEVEESKKQLLQRQQEHQIVSKLHAILRPFVFRRVKADVDLSIPDKREVIVYTPLTALQRHYYRAIVRGDAEYVAKSRTTVNQLMQLRKVCNHPFLIYEDVDSSFSTDERIVESCGKLQVLDSILQRLQEEGGHKVLIFSQMTKMLDILEDFCEYRDMSTCRLDGGTKAVDRHAAVKSFNDENDDTFVFLLSTRAGGLGLNLTAADTVIIYDSDWNPTQDAQAQDRCHRIGQTKPVVVLRLITPNSAELDSVEMKVLSRSQSKRKLEDLVIARGGLNGRTTSKSKRGRRKSKSSSSSTELERQKLREKWEDSLDALSINQVTKQLLNVSSKRKTGHSQDSLEWPDEELDMLLARTKASFSSTGMAALEEKLKGKAKCVPARASLLTLFA